MNPTVVAAWIAAGVSVLILIGTLLAQYLGYRASGRDAEKTAEDQRKQLDSTFAEQNQQLDRTHTQQREQLDGADPGEQPGGPAEVHGRFLVSWAARVAAPNRVNR